MKKKLVVLLFLLVGLMLAACNPLSRVPPEESTAATTEWTSKQIYKDEFLFAFSWSSYEEIEAFLAVAGGTAEEYARYAEGAKLSVSYEEAIKIKNNFLSMPLPTCSDSSKFYCHYSVSDDIMEWAHNINGVWYSMLYYFDSSSDGEYEGEPAMSDIPFGDVTVDLYPMGRYFEGEVQQGTTRVVIRTTENNLHDGLFDVFEFRTISSDIVTK